MYGSNPAAYYQQMMGDPATFRYFQQQHGNYLSAFNFDYQTYNPQLFNTTWMPQPSQPPIINPLGENDNNRNQENVKVEKKKKVMEYPMKRDQNYGRVFIWDLDDVTMMNRKMVEDFSIKYPNSPIIPINTLVEQIVRSKFPPAISSITPSFDLTNYDDLSASENPMNRHDEVERYSKVFEGFKEYYEMWNGMEDGLMNRGVMEHLGMGEQVENYEGLARQCQMDQRWIWSRKCLEIVKMRSDDSKQNYGSVILSSDGIPYSSSQLILTGMSEFVPIENIYSTQTTTIQPLIQRIRKRFGDNCSLMMITSKKDIARIAKEEKLPVWPIDGSDSINRLYTAMRDYLTGNGKK